MVSHDNALKLLQAYGLLACVESGKLWALDARKGLNLQWIEVDCSLVELLAACKLLAG